MILPTRELAVQVADDIKRFLLPFLTLQSLIGGQREVSFDVQLIQNEG